MAFALRAGRSFVGQAFMCSTSSPSTSHPLPPTAWHGRRSERRANSNAPHICRAGPSTLSKSEDVKPFIQPLPTVKIDNTSDPFATKVSVEYGENLGELMDSIVALKNLGLNIRRAKLVEKGASGPRNVFYITDAQTSEKIVRSVRLEEIRMVIIHSLVSSYPESASQLVAAVKSVDEEQKPGYIRRVVPTTVDVDEAPNGSCSVLKITTPDRPGLLVDIVRTLKDINLNVVSAEIDTIGEEAQDEFFITYHGEPLSSSMVQLVTNALQYYLSLSEVAKEESY